jgi:hypothetical protein
MLGKTSVSMMVPNSNKYLEFGEANSMISKIQTHVFSL